MSFWDKWKFPIMAAAATVAAPYAAPALAGLFGGGAAGTAGAGAAAGEAGGGLLAGELASQALPGMMETGTLPALLPMDAMTFPEGAMPAEDLIISGLESGRQGALDPSLMQLGQRGMASLTRTLGDPKMRMAAGLLGRASQRPQAPMMAAAPPQPMPYEPVSRSLTPAEQRRYRALGSFIA